MTGSSSTVVRGSDPTSCGWSRSALVLGGPPNEKGSRGIWGFHQLDGPNGTTRLLERGRKVVGKGLPEKPGWDPYLMDPIRFVMSKKMLQNIKKLAEDSRS